MWNVMPRSSYKIFSHYGIDRPALCHLHARNVNVSTGSVSNIRNSDLCFGFILLYPATRITSN
jgi:hypothetical protein